MISVIVPVYNAEDFIERCLDSIIGQTYTDFEVILVNDGSSDQSECILLEYEKKDSRIKVISQKNKGVAGARNTGLKAASGDFILYVDADDWIEPVMLEHLLRLMTDDCDIVMCGSDQASDLDGRLTVDDVQTDTWDHDKQLMEFMKHKKLNGMLWNKLIRRCITDGINFNEKTGYGEDAEFLWKVLKCSRNMVCTNEVLYHHVLEENSITHLSFSDKKYSAIPMWEEINAEVVKDYPELLVLARERLMCAAVFSLYEIKNCGYNDKEKIKHMRAIARKHIGIFLKSGNVSVKYKLYAVAVCLGY